MRILKTSKTILLGCMILVLSLVGCGEKEIMMPYSSMTENPSYSINDQNSTGELNFFAKDLAATNKDITDTSGFDPSNLYAAAVYDVNEKNVLYSYHATDKVNPASITKIMTALVVLDACASGEKSLDETITIGDVSLKESGAQTSGLAEGDRIQVRDLFNIALVYSGNDASLALAQYVAGSEESFVALMNQKAVALGCTGTHFYNSNGLTHEEHYTTAYDIYLMFNAVMKYPEFVEAIKQPSYSVSYFNVNGEAKEKTFTSTNKFLTGDYQMTAGATVMGGKTGSTNAAGKCLIEYMTDSAGKPYIAIIMGATDEDTLYKNMRSLCGDFIK